LKVRKVDVSKEELISRGSFQSNLEVKTCRLLPSQILQTLCSLSSNNLQLSVVSPIEVGVIRTLLSQLFFPPRHENEDVGAKRNNG
jgi:hypothetical protein